VALTTTYPPFPFQLTVPTVLRHPLEPLALTTTLAILDTGSNTTAIDASIATRELQLVAFDSLDKIDLPSPQGKLQMAAAAVQIRCAVGGSDRAAIEVPIKAYLFEWIDDDPRIGLILGMDVLRFMDMAYLTCSSQAVLRLYRTL
jgi:hypothetical protein